MYTLRFGLNSSDVARSRTYIVARLLGVRNRSGTLDGNRLCYTQRPVHARRINVTKVANLLRGASVTHRPVHTLRIGFGTTSQRTDCRPPPLGTEDPPWVLIVFARDQLQPIETTRCHSTVLFSFPILDLTPSYR